MALAATVAGALPAGAAAVPTRSLGETPGVASRATGKFIRVIFSGPARRLYRRQIAGRRVRVECSTVSRDRFGASFGSTAGGPVRAPRRRPRLRSGFSGRYDVCEVIRPDFRRKRGRSVTTFGPRVVATDALTARGRTFLDERARAGLLEALIDTALANADDDERLGRFPPADKITPPGGQALAPLPEPSASPPPGALGYFSDGAQHVTAVSLSARGRRLFIDVNQDSLSTNVLTYLVDPE